MSPGNPRAGAGIRYDEPSARAASIAFEGGGTSPSYFILLDWEDGALISIHDYRYVPYIASEAEIRFV